jgi:hypothetical protein
MEADIDFKAPRPPEHTGSGVSAIGPGTRITAGATGAGATMVGVAGRDATRKAEKDQWEASGAANHKSVSDARFRTFQYSYDYQQNRPGRQRGDWEADG